MSEEIPFAANGHADESVLTVEVVVTEEPGIDELVVAGADVPPAVDADVDDTPGEPEGRRQPRRKKLSTVPEQEREAPHDEPVAYGLPAMPAAASAAPDADDVVELTLMSSDAPTAYDPPPATATAEALAIRAMGTEDQWPVNRVVLCGRIEFPKGRPMRINGLSTGGSAFVQKTLLVAEPGLGDFADLASKRITLLVPNGLPSPQAQLLSQGEGKEPREGAPVCIVGRIVQEKVRDPRYQKGNGFGGEMIWKSYVKVLAVHTLADAQDVAELAIFRARGVVEVVNRTFGPLNTSRFASAAGQPYHLVTLAVREEFIRPLPGAAPRVDQVRIKVFVPADLAYAAMLLVPGNPVAVETDFLQTTAFLPDGHELLREVDAEKADQLRRRTSDHLVVTRIIPGADAKAPEVMPKKSLSRRRQIKRRPQIAVAE